MMFGKHLFIAAGRCQSLKVIPAASFTRTVFSGSSRNFGSTVFQYKDVYQQHQGGRRRDDRETTSYSRPRRNFDSESQSGYQQRYRGNQENRDLNLGALFASFNRRNPVEIMKNYQACKETESFKLLEENQISKIYWKLSQLNAKVLDLNEVVQDIQACGGEIRSYMYQDLLFKASYQNNYEAAKSTFDTMKSQNIQLEENDYNSMMLAAFKREMHEEALDYYKMASSALSNNLHMIKRTAGLVYGRLGQLEESNKLLLDYIKQEQSDLNLARAYDILCENFIVAKRFDEAERYMKEAGDKKLPETGGLLRNRFRLLLENGQMDAARKLLVEDVENFDFQNSRVREPFREHFIIFTEILLQQNETKKLLEVLEYYESLSRKIPRKSGKRLSFVPYQKAMETFFDGNKLTEAQDVFRAMPQFKYQYEPLMRYVVENSVRLGDLDFANNILKDSPHRAHLQMVIDEAKSKADEKLDSEGSSKVENTPTETVATELKSGKTEIEKNEEIKEIPAKANVAETKPVDAKPAEAKSVVEKPVEVKSTETKPQTSKPETKVKFVESKAESKATESKETKPTESKSAETKQ